MLAKSIPAHTPRVSARVNQQHPQTALECMLLPPAQTLRLPFWNMLAPDPSIVAARVIRVGFEGKR